MYSYVFLLGRPGSGKSVIYKMLSKIVKERGLAEEVMRLDDFPVLEEILEEDVSRDKHVRKEGGFEITDFSILDDVLQRMNDRLKDLQKPERLIFVEFSRDSYEDAMKNFDQEILDDSLIVYIYCPFELCLERNEERFKEGRRETDNHIVPTDQMKTYYRNDDYEDLFLDSPENLKEATPADTEIVRNDFDGMDELREELEPVVDSLSTKA